ncbi:MAG TPA: helix-turn-helix domain-containing protein [Gemmatimonadaceae bacterium]|nr:helix-turn-helix domain-containing protein [Gemmatimonadaceae bacterium]
MNATSAPLPDLETIADAKRAAVLMHPLRLRILQLATEPTSATEIARQLKQSRQMVNYHVRELARTRFLKRAGQHRKRNLIEQRYVATARAYLLDPALLGTAGADPRRMSDTMSAGFLLGLAALTQAELSRAMREAGAKGARLSTMSINTELRFESTAQRADFARALQAAVVDVVARHSSPSAAADGRPGPGRPFRLVLGCYPIPPRSDAPPSPEER